MKKPSQPVGRPREFVEEDVLDAVMKLFWKQGYEGTGLKDILTATGLTKGSIYKAFESKHNLYLKSLERYEKIYVDSAVTSLKSTDDPISRLDEFLSAPIKNMSVNAPNKGCFLCNSSADRASSDEETRALVQRSFRKLSAALSSAIYEIRPEWPEKRIQQTAQMMLSVYSGLRIMSRSREDIDIMKDAKDGALALIK
ncbi:TetR/AcrR family transcriptional regulator [Litorimonas taeanensis]|nr:TetR/AcrR family transcriptional regulator [Litorimonas taeanensis]